MEVLVTALVGALGALVMLDRAHLSTTARNPLSKATANEKNLAVLTARVDARIGQIQEDVAEIRDILREEKKR